MKSSCGGMSESFSVRSWSTRLTLRRSRSSRLTALRIQGSAASWNFSRGISRMNWPLSQVSLWTSKMAGDRLIPAMSKASTSSARVNFSRSVPGFQPSRAM